MFLVILAPVIEVDDVVLVVDVVLSVVFLGDFLARFNNAHDKRLYFTQGLGWLDLISCVPFLRSPASSASDASSASSAPKAA